MVDIDIRGNIPKKRKYNAKEFFEFIKDKPEIEHYELINGEIYMMAAPAVEHQRIIRFLSTRLSNYLEGKPCEPFIASVDVVLFEKNKKNDSQNVFQPDVFVVCNPKKITKERIYGAPDFVVEVVSPSNSEHDYIDKLSVYMKYGVKEYWIVNPMTKKIFVYIKGKKEVTVNTYTFDDKIKVGIFEDDFSIDFKELRI
ncbi:MAG: Uma2 family endonuclease [Oscillospiraceae bacterium]|nr:Uma2 family endonuclease [Oscillospiraceae bacterium]